MSDENNDTAGDDSQSIIPGAGDEPYLTPVQANKIVASFLNPQKKFPFSADVAKYAIRCTIKNMRDPDSRVRNGAVRNLMAMARINQMDEHKRVDIAAAVVNPEKNAASVNVNVGVSVGQVVRETLENDPEYAKWKRSQLLGSGNAALVGEESIVGKLPNSPASGAAG